MKGKAFCSRRFAPSHQKVHTMAMTINTNIISINAQRNLGLSGASLGTTMQRLSSGLRVNSAKDDAAGLAIAERMNGQARGLKVAARNANDGISLAQTAEGALGKMGDMLQRMRELAVQSSNATNSADDRKALQAEVDQLRSEIDRVANTTSFNGKKILDGSFAGGVFQVGANAGDNITVGNITNAKADALGNVKFGSSVTATIKAGDISVLDEIEAGTLSIRVGADAAIDLGVIKEANSGAERLGQVVAAINAKTADTGVTAFLVAGDVQGDYTVELRSDNPDKGVSLTGFTAATTGVGRVASMGMPAATSAAYEALLADIDVLASKTGFAAAISSTNMTTGEAGGVFTDAFNLAASFGAVGTSGTPGHTLNAAATAFQNVLVTFMWKTTPAGVPATIADATAWGDGTNGALPDLGTVRGALTTLRDAVTAQYAAQQTANLTAIDTAMSGLQTATKADFATKLGALETALSDTAVGLLPAGGTLGIAAITAASSDAEFQAAWGQALSDASALTESGFGIKQSQITDYVGIEDIDIGTQEGAWNAIKQIDSSIDQVNSARADLGALQTRFEKSIENIDIMNENITAARGRIVDADFASETANLSRAQILQQAGTAMVAQANQLPQQVLSLLQ